MSDKRTSAKARLLEIYAKSYNTIYELEELYNYSCDEEARRICRRIQRDVEEIYNIAKTGIKYDHTPIKPTPRSSDVSNSQIANLARGGKHD